jgi:sec-independent protein translocase protein TatA
MAPILAVLGLSGGELMLVLAAVLILFGAKKIPDFAKGLGQGIKEFKKASREVQDEIERAGEELHSPPPPPPPPPPPSSLSPYAPPEATIPAGDPNVGSSPSPAASTASNATPGEPGIPLRT